MLDNVNLITPIFILLIVSHLTLQHILFFKKLNFKNTITKPKGTLVLGEIFII